MNNIEEIVSIFVDSIFLKKSYEEMKKIRKKEKNKNIKNNRTNDSIKKNKKKLNNSYMSNKKNKEIYTPVKIIKGKSIKKRPKKNENLSTTKKKRSLKINLFSDTKSNNFDTKGINKTQYKEKSISQIDIKDFKDDNLQLTTKLTKELIKKQQEELNYKKKLIYLKKRIEALKVKEDSMITEKNYFQKKKIIKERNIEIKNIQKKIIEEFKKKEKMRMKHKKENVKRKYEEEKMLRNYGSELSFKNRQSFKKLKADKMKMKIEQIKEDKMTINNKLKNKNSLKNIKYINAKKTCSENQELKNNQKMNYIFSTISIESTKKDIRALEKLEKDYLKRIENIKNGKIDIPKIRSKSAIKSKKRYKLLYSKRNEKKNNLNTMMDSNKNNEKEKDFSINDKDIILNEMDIDNITLDKQLNYKYRDDSLKSDDSY
jgi:hypothetical protein